MEINLSKLSTKEYLIRILSKEKNVIGDKILSEATINDVITHQFDSAAAAILKHNTVELSGWGKFWFNENKAEKIVAIYEDAIVRFNERINEPECPISERIALQMKISIMTGNIKLLKPKIKK
jgi:nucleoid DNA-binding protein